MGKVVRSLPVMEESATKRAAAAPPGSRGADAEPGGLAGVRCADHRVRS
jgi:hypothetical protein